MSTNADLESHSREHEELPPSPELTRNQDRGISAQPESAGNGPDDGQSRERRLTKGNSVGATPGYTWSRSRRRGGCPRAYSDPHVNGCGKRFGENVRRSVGPRTHSWDYDSTLFCSRLGNCAGQQFFPPSTWRLTAGFRRCARCARSQLLSCKPRLMSALDSQPETQTLQGVGAI